MYRSLRMLTKSLILHSMQASFTLYRPVDLMEQLESGISENQTDHCSPLKMTKVVTGSLKFVITSSMISSSLQVVQALLSHFIVHAQFQLNLLLDSTDLLS